MLIEVKHVQNIIYRAANEVVTSVIEAQLCYVLTVTLSETTYRLLQFVDVPPDDVFVCACTYQIAVGSH